MSSEIFVRTSNGSRDNEEKFDVMYLNSKEDNANNYVDDSKILSCFGRFVVVNEFH